MPDDRKPFHNPFEALATPGGRLPAAQPESSARPAAAKTLTRVIPRAVVRIERAGRGGKVVTVVERLDVPSGERAHWLKAFKSALACGGSIEGDALVFQGDQRERLPGLLAARGVKRVTVS